MHKYMHIVIKADNWSQKKAQLVMKYLKPLTNFINSKDFQKFYSTKQANILFI